MIGKRKKERPAKAASPSKDPSEKSDTPPSEDGPSTSATSTGTGSRFGAAILRILASAKATEPSLRRKVTTADLNPPRAGSHAAENHDEEPTDDAAHVEWTMRMML